MTRNSFEAFKKYRVDALNVDSFLMRYYRPDRLTDTLTKKYQDEFDKNGYCFISKYDSVTREIVSYYGSI